MRIVGNGTLYWSCIILYLIHVDCQLPNQHLSNLPPACFGYPTSGFSQPRPHGNHVGFSPCIQSTCRRSGSFCNLYCLIQAGCEALSVRICISTYLCICVFQIQAVTDSVEVVSPNPDPPIGRHEQRPNQDCLELCMMDYAVRGG